MGTVAKAFMGKEKFYTDVLVSHHLLHTDEPEENGGGDRAPKPMDLLCSALASCTVMTLRMYADRKGWNVGEIKADFWIDREEGVYHKRIAFPGAELDESQTKRLLEVADKCPVSKFLLSSPRVETTLDF